MQITRVLVLFSLFYVSCIQAAPARRRKGKGTPDTPQPSNPPPPSPPVLHSHGDIVGARAKEYENSKVDTIHPGVVVGGPDPSNNYKVAMISKNLPGSPPRESIATYQPGTSMEGSVSHNAPKVVPGNKLKPWLEKGSGSGRRQPPLTAVKLAELKQAISACPTGESLSRRGCVPRKPTTKKSGVKVIMTKGGLKGPTQRQKPTLQTGGTKRPSSAKPNAQSVKKGGAKPPAQKPVSKNAGAKKPVQKPVAKAKPQPLEKGGTRSPAQKPVPKKAGAKKPVQKSPAKQKGGAKSPAQKAVPKNAGVKKPVQKPAAKPKAQPLKKGGAKSPAQKPISKNVAAKKPVQKPLTKPPAQKGGAKAPTQKPVPKSAAKQPVQKPLVGPAAQPVKNGGAKPPAQKPAAKPVSKPPAKPAQRKH